MGFNGKNISTIIINEYEFRRGKKAPVSADSCPG
jgi:hypothetical protein